MPTESAEDARDEREDERGGRAPGDGVGEVLRAVPVLSRAGWFALGAVVGAAVVLLTVVRPFGRGSSAERAPPYEGFPFADNAGVCQEHVALATVQTSRTEAEALARRLGSALPAGLRPDNIRVVRALAPGELWTIAVDAESGSGTRERSAQVAAALNAAPGAGVHFEPVFYSTRRCSDPAHVLCMPRAAPGGP